MLHNLCKINIKQDTMKKDSDVTKTRLNTRTEVVNAVYKPLVILQFLMEIVSKP